MIDTSHLLRKVDLQILNQNWDRVRKLHKTVSSARDEKKYTTAEYEEQFQITHYKFDSKVELAYSNTLSKNWDVLSGPMLIMTLPWYKQYEEIFQPLNLNYVGWSVTTGNLSLHQDVARESEKHLDHCNINYIVYSEDPNARTVVYDVDDNTIQASYPSTPGEAHLLRIEYPHELISTGYREILQFKFHNTYQEIADFLDKTGPIRLDSAKS